MFDLRTIRTYSTANMIDVPIPDKIGQIEKQFILLTQIQDTSYLTSTCKEFFQLYDDYKINNFLKLINLFSVISGSVEITIVNKILDSSINYPKYSSAGFHIDVVKYRPNWKFIRFILTGVGTVLELLDLSDIERHYLTEYQTKVHQINNIELYHKISKKSTWEDMQIAPNRIQLYENKGMFIEGGYYSGCIHRVTTVGEKISFILISSEIRTDI